MKRLDPRRSSLVLLGIIYLGFVSLGLPDGTLGVAWPGIAAELRLPIGWAGAITTVITLLSALSGFQSGRVVRHLRTGPVVLSSCILTGGALVGFSYAPSFAWLLVAAVPLGLGAGAVDASLNGYVAQHYSGRQMNWLHACWGVGATCGPMVMGQAMATPGGWRNGYLLLGGAQLSLALVFLFTLGLWTRVPERTTAASLDGEIRAGPALPAHSLAAWLSPLLIALYVALEMTAGLWSASLLTLQRGFSATDAAWCTAGYYGAITAGRLAAGVVVDRWGNRRVIAGGLFIALLGAVVFVFARAVGTAAGALVLVGLGFAPVYPGLMHEVPRRFSAEASLIVIGRQSGAAYLGMAIVPAALGALAARSLEAIPVCMAVGVAGLLWGIRRLDRMT